MQRGSRFPLALGMLAVGAVLWFGLGMNRGPLLSTDIQSKVWPWAPFISGGEIVAPALSDPVWQFVPWLEFARRELLQGRLPLWNPHQAGGVPLLGNGQSALGSPLYWPVLLLGVGGGWNVSLLLRLLLAFCGTYLWLRDVGRSSTAAILGAVAFALSGPFIAWLEHPQTLTAAALPFVLLFTRRLARDPARRDLVGLAAATYCVMSGGHAETQLMAALLGAAVLAQAAPRPRGVAIPATGALLGAALAAPVLIPFFEYFRVSEARLGVDRRPFVLPIADLARFLFPRVTDSNVIEAAATVSLTVLVLAAAGLGRARRDPGVLFWTATALIVLLVSYRNPLSLALARHTPIHWTRALVLLPLALGYLASGMLDALRERARAAGHPAFAHALGVAAVSLASGELLFAAQGVHGHARPGDLTLTTPLIEALRADRGIFRILPLHTFLPPDSATRYGLDDVRGFDALSTREWRNRLESMGRVIRVPTQVEVVEPWDLVPGGGALDDWNVKYLLLHPQFSFGAAELNAKRGLDLEEVYSGADGRILKNRRVRPRARLAGPGRLDIEEGSPRRWRFRVETREANVLTLANPMFPGWTARIDGRPVRLETAAGEAIAVGVPEGRHGVELVYAPWSFRIGCVTAFAAALTLALLARRSSPRQKAAPGASA